VLLVFTAMLQTLFYPTGVEGKSDRFLAVERITQTRKDDWNSNGIGYKVIDQYLRKMKSVELVAALSGTTAVSVFQDDRVVEVIMRRTDDAYWKILDFTVLAGRVINADDYSKGRFVSVLNASTAIKLFGVRGKTDNHVGAIGQKVNVMGQFFEVIGVVEDELHLSAYAGLWAPISTLPNSSYRNSFIGDFSALLLAKSNADFPRIKDEMVQISNQINKDAPERFDHTYLWADDKLDFIARTLFDNQSTADSGASKLIAVIAFLMLLFMALPALNLINLNAGRIMERASEIGVRKAFGASTSQLVAQFLMENILLCVLGGVIGIALAKGALLWLGYIGIVPYLKVDLSWQVLGYGFLLSVVFGLLSGVVPAWRMARLDPVRALKGGA
jgi:putative ABC transport system permease protein